MPDQVEIQLSDEDIEFLVSLLRSSASAMTTLQLVEALRARAR